MNSQLQQVIETLQLWEVPEDATIEERRSELVSFISDYCPTPSDAHFEPMSIANIPAEWATAPGVEPERTILYLHGGGYVVGSPYTHRSLTARLARSAAARVLVPDYRLAPEDPYPAAVDDAVSAYRWLLESGTPAQQICIVGDSAGGGLTIATLLALREAGDEQPAAAVAISPWVDLSCDSESLITNVDTDPMINQEGLTGLADLHLGEADVAEPLASPVYADLTGLPPLLIQVGEAEMLLDDSTRLAANGEDAGVIVTLERWPDMPHVWHLFADKLPEGEQAIESIGTFVREHTVSG